ncbi:MAG: ParB/RepB/Spo0J family partition protein [Vibrio sp.]
MRNDIQVNTKPSSVSVQAVKRVAKKELKAGDTMTKIVLGKKVKFKLEIVPPEHIEQTTMVFLDNERIQSLLDEMAIADIAESFKEHGQEYPAIGRKTNSVIEVAEGSRRRFAGITFKKPYLIWVGDLDDAQMLHLSDVGNQYKGVSAYEKGKRYERLLKKGNQEEVANSLKISRRMLMKYVNTSRLPERFIQCLPSPNDLSANEGERLFKLWENCKDKTKLERLTEKLNTWYSQKLEKKWDADILIKTFANSLEAKDEKTEQKRELAMGATITVKNGNATIKVPKISDDSREKIENFIAKILSEEAVNNC